MADHPASKVLRYIRDLAEVEANKGLTDGQLLALFAREHQEAAFASLLKRHGRLVWSVCRHILGQEHDAEDAFQATFLVLARRPGSIRNAEALASWLHGVAYRVAMKAMKNRRQRQAHEQRASVVAPSSSDLAWRELQTVLDEEVQRLPEKYRAPFILCCLEGRPRDEVSSELSLNQGTVSSRIARARRLLQDRLCRRGVTLSAALCATDLWTNAAAGPVPAALAAGTIKAACAAAKGTFAGASSGAVLLAESVMGGMTLAKWHVGAVLVIAFSVLAAGAGQWLGRAPLAITAEAKMADDVVPATAFKKDLYGDPLPPGAVKRLGTLRQRLPAARFALTGDGKEIVAVNDLLSVRRFNALTGELRSIEQLPRDGDRSLNTWVSPRATFVLASDISAAGAQLEVWDLAQGKRTQAVSLGQGMIRAAAFSEDERFVAFSALTQGNKVSHEVMVWDLKSAKPNVLRSEIDNRASGPYPSPVVVIAPDGKRVAALVPGNSLRCWNVKGGELLWQATAKGNASLFFSPDGQKVVAASESEAIALEWWDALSGKSLEATNQPPKEAARLVGFVPGGPLLAFETKGGEIVLWDADNAKIVERLPAPRTGDSGAPWQHLYVFTPDGKGLMRRTNGLQRFDLTTGKAVYPDTEEWGHTAAVLRLVFSPDGSLLASSSVDQTTRVWAAATARALHVFPKDRTHHLAFSPDGQSLFVRARGADDVGLRQWDLATGRAKQDYNFPDHPGPHPIFYSKELQVSPDGKTVFMTNFRWDQGYTTWLSTWDLQNAKCLEHRHLPWAADCILTADGKEALSMNRNTGIVEMVDIATGKPRVQFAPPLGRRLEGYTMTLSPSGGLMATRAGFVGDAKIIDGPIEISNTRTGRQIMKLPVRRTIVNQRDIGDRFAFTADDRLFAAITPQGIRLWEIVSGQEIGALDPNPALARETFCIAFSPDGRILASGHADSTILLWDATLRAGARGGQLTPAQAETRWSELAGDNASRANAAFWALVDDPERSVLLFMERLKPTLAPRPEVTQPLLRDLDGDSFKLREAATKKLEELGELAEPALRVALKAKPSLETERRIQGLLEKLSASGPLKGEGLRAVRAVRILERIGTREARAMLERLGQGLESASLTVTAKDSLRRMAND
jgi:RNA polymerase sigma factor (sigma-70 family)